jgi:trehalose synthase
MTNSPPDGGKGPRVTLVASVGVPRRPVAPLASIIGAERYERLAVTAAQFRRELGGHTVWNVNSTASGGGVAEMLQVIVGYASDLGIPVQWLVIAGDPEFFAITKRLHNQLHGDPAGGPLGRAEAGHYARVQAANAAELVKLIQPGDIVLLHDPQTAGLAAALARAGARVAWRCHIGVDWSNDATVAAWEFLRPHVTAARAYVFSRAAYVPAWLPPGKVTVVPPSIDPFSPKNQELSDGAVRSILATAGVLDASAAPERNRFVRRDGGTGIVTRRAQVICDGLPGPGEPLVVQVSRWDRLKDMSGVMRAFARYVVPDGPGYLALAGPAVEGVLDDPEGAAVYRECRDQWQALAPAARERIMLVTLPLDDIDENAAMVNALQRHAMVISQKSLAEGFGLTVAEGMWKGRPVVGSAVGGIMDQIAAGTGVLLPGPRDLAAFGAAVTRLLSSPAEAARMGAAAHAFIRANYVGDLHLLRYAGLFSQMLAPA